MLDDIAAARDHILFEMYLFESGDVATRFIDALVAAREHNVLVHLLLDDYGSKRLNRTDRQRLLRAGIHLCLYNPMRRGHLLHNLRRTHRKILVIDGHIAWTGGTGICDEFDGRTHGQLYWHDTMTRIEGPCAGDWQRLFHDSWQRHATTPLPPVTDPPPLPNGSLGRVTNSRAPTHSEVMRSFIQHVRHASRRVWLTTPYFVVSRKFLRSLRRRADHGVDVRILLPGPHSDHPWTRYAGRHYYTRLLQHGVRIFEYQPRFIHTKQLICDDWLSVGSSNADRWNLRWNLDANQEIRCPATLAAAAAQFEQDLAHSQEILPDQWRKRPWRDRFHEWVSHQMVRLLSWFSYNRRH